MQEHGSNKHEKTLDECFPGFVEIQKKDEKGGKGGKDKKEANGDKKTGKK